MGFLPSYSCFNITAWMHHIDADKRNEEKAICEVQKNATHFLKQIWKATPPKTAIIWPLASHQTNHPSKRNKTSGALLGRNKDEFISDVLPRTTTL